MSTPDICPLISNGCISFVKMIRTTFLEYTWAVIQFAPFAGALVVVIMVGFLTRKYGRIDPWM